MENDKFLICDICAHHCRLRDGATGLCKVHQRRGDKIVSLAYGRVVAENIDPIEKKPLFHVQPGSLTYSISTCGCNFRCKHCQNSSISQVSPNIDVESTGVYRSPEQVVSHALAGGCRSISYTYVEPTVFFEFAYDCSVAAKQAGLGNIFVTNGYLSQQSGEKIAPYLMAANIDLKSFSEKFYRDICGAKLQPVLDSIRLLHSAGVWIEITTLLIPGYNDSDGELAEIAEFICEVNPDIPWHVTGFFPTYKLTDAPPTSTETLIRARRIGLDNGVRFVYTGNRPGVEGESTYCPQCDKTVISRKGYRVSLKPSFNGLCDGCGLSLPGIWE